VEIWLDAELPPALAVWMTERFRVRALPVRVLGLQDASDAEIYRGARVADVVVMTKDVDFVRLQERLGPPPRLVWLTCGNTSHAALRALLDRHWCTVEALLREGNPLVEVGPLD